MFNEEQKMEYISYKESNSQLPFNYLLRLFETTSEYEEDNDKDIFDFTKGEIIDMYKSMNVRRVEVLTNINSQLSGYSQWGIQNLLVSDSQDHFMEFEYSTLLEFVNKDTIRNGIITRKELMSAILDLPCYSDRFILLCIFEGIKGNDCEEIRQLMPEDFDGLAVHLRGGRIAGLSDYDRTITISEELKELAIQAYNENVRVVSREGGYTEVPLVDEGFIIKRTQVAVTRNANPAFTKRLTNCIELCYELSSDVNATSIRNSGKIHFIKERAKELGITPEEYLIRKQYRCELDNRFNDATKGSTFLSKYKEFLSNG